MDQCKKAKLIPVNITPDQNEDASIVRIYPVVAKLIDLAKMGDLAAIEIILQLIESDDSMPFGMTLKSRGSRALKVQAHLLNSNQQNRLINRVINMESRGYTPREFYEYSRLSRMLIRIANNHIK